MTVSGKDAVYDKTAHAVDIGIELSEEWGKVEVPYEIFYTREGAQTEDSTIIWYSSSLNLTVTL